MDRRRDNRLVVCAFHVGPLLRIYQVLRRALVELDRFVEEVLSLGELIVFDLLLLRRLRAHAAPDVSSQPPGGASRSSVQTTTPVRWKRVPVAGRMLRHAGPVVVRLVLDRAPLPVGAASDSGGPGAVQLPSPVIGGDSAPVAGHTGGRTRNPRRQQSAAPQSGSPRPKRAAWNFHLRIWKRYPC